MIMALSGILAPQVVKGLLNSFSDQVSINIVGAILFSGLLGSAFFYPAKVEEDSNKKPEGSNEAHETMINNGNANQNESKKQSIWKKNPIVKMFLLINWKLLKSPHFILTALGSSYSFNALLSFYVFLPLFAESYNYTITQKVSHQINLKNWIILLQSPAYFSVNFTIHHSWHWSCNKVYIKSFTKLTILCIFLFF